MCCFFSEYYRLLLLSPEKEPSAGVKMSLSDRYYPASPQTETKYHQPDDHFKQPMTIYGSWRLMTHIPLAGEYPQKHSNHPFLKGLIHHESTTPHLCPLRSTPRSRHLIWASAVPSPQVPCAVGSSNPVLQHETVQDKGGKVSGVVVLTFDG